MRLGDQRSLLRSTTERMPFKSKAQRRKFAQLLVEGKITPDVYEEWNRETGGSHLPERVEKRKAATRRKSSARPRKKRKAKTKTASKRRPRPRTGKRKTSRTRNRRR